MKEILKKGDVFGPLVAAGTLLYFLWKGGVWSHYHTAGIVVGAVFLLLAIALKADEIQASLGRRSTKLGINSFTSILLVLGILVLVNYLGSKHFKQTDMTEEGLHTLSDKSNETLDKLTQDVNVKAYYAASLSAGSDALAKDSLGRYTDRNAKFKVEFIDLERHPDVARTEKITENGTLVIEMGGQKERIVQRGKISEEEVTNVLIKLVKGDKKTIYFIDQHDEKQISDGGKEGASRASEKLAGENYTVKPLSLARERKVPSDASAVVLMGPRAEPFPSEIDALDQYLNGGGSAMILLDPPPDTASMIEFARKWGVDVGNNLVIDFSLDNQFQGTGPAVPLVKDYGKHPITEKMRKYTYFHLARSIGGVIPPANDLTVTPLLLTSQESWGETDMKSLSENKVAFDQGKDVAGPVTLGVAVNKDLGDKKKARLVFIGNSDFASNNYFGSQGNGDLFVNAIAWLSRDESFIAIPPKDPQNHEVTMTASQYGLFWFVVILFFPGAILVSGIAVRATRR